MSSAPSQANLARTAGGIVVALITYVIAALVSVVLINMLVGQYVDPQFVNLWACLVSGGLGVAAAYWTLKLSKTAFSGKAIFAALAVLMLTIVGLAIVKLRGQPVYWVEIGAQVAGTLVAGFFAFWRHSPEPKLLD